MFDQSTATEDERSDVHPVVAAVSVLTTESIPTCDSDGLAAAARRIKRVRAYLDGLDATIAQRAAVLHLEGRSARPDEVLARHGSISAKEAKRVGRRAEMLAETPGMSAALSAGEITAGHADALADATRNLNDLQRAELLAKDEQLAERAAASSPERFGAYCKKLAEGIVDDEGAEKVQHDRRETKLTKFIHPGTGRYILNGEFDDELGAALFKAIDDEVRALLYAAGPLPGVVPGLEHDIDHLAAHALGYLVKGGRVARRPSEADLQVLIDLQTLLGGWHERSVCETSGGVQFPISTARRLACQARIIPTVLGSEGEVLDQGRAQRQPTRAQRRALRAMYRTCAFEGCCVSFTSCQIHHIDPWELLGPTDLCNLVPLCVLHHHMVHEGGWGIELLERRVLRITRPDGVHHADTPLRVAADRADAARAAAARGTSPPGRPPDRVPNAGDADPPGDVGLPDDVGPPGRSVPPGHSPPIRRSSPFGPAQGRPVSGRGRAARQPQPQRNEATLPL